MTISPDDVALAAVLGGTFLFAQWQNHKNLAAERKHAAAQAAADRKHELAKAGSES